jgi:hypothetical protein
VQPVADTLTEQYWATKPTAELCRILDTKIDTFYEWLRTSGQLALWRLMMSAYYAGAEDGGTLGVAGDQEEYTTIKANHLHNIGEHIVVMVTGSRPHFEPKAINTDHESMAQTILAAALLETAHREKDLEGISIEATRNGGQFGEAYGTITWDPNAGREFAVNPATGRPEKGGDIKYACVLPCDVARDTTKSNTRQHVWYAIREPVNKWDLAARFPDLADKIRQLPSCVSEQQRRPRMQDETRRVDSDDVWLWHWYHDRTDSLPDGRYVQMLSGDLWCFEGPLPYPWLPVVRLAPEEIPGSQRGYTSFFDLLPLQHAVNSIKSLTLSHISNYGTGVWWAPAGAQYTVEDLKGGFTLVKGGTQPPVPQPPPLLPEHLPATEQQLVGDIETISGVNAVVRGNPGESLGKGAPAQALALMDSKAVQFTAGLQRGYVRWLEAMATKTVEIYQRFAKAPQVAYIAGKSKAMLMKEWTGESIAKVNRVTVDIGNPMTRTIAGRMAIAQMLLEMPSSPIKTPEHLLEVLSTGRLEPAIEGTQAELLNIRAENERLQEGGTVLAMATDNHPLHMREHAVVGASPEARENVALIEGLAMHQQEHAQLWRTTDPALLMAMGVPPPPPPPMPAGPPGVTPGGPTPPGPGAAGAPPTDAMPPPPGNGVEPNLPPMPPDPVTGESNPMPVQ